MTRRKQAQPECAYHLGVVEGVKKHVRRHPDNECEDRQGKVQRDCGDQDARGKIGKGSPVIFWPEPFWCHVSVLLLPAGLPAARLKSKKSWNYLKSYGAVNPYCARICWPAEESMNCSKSAAMALLVLCLRIPIV